MKLLKIALYK